MFMVLLSLVTGQAVLQHCVSHAGVLPASPDYRLLCCLSTASPALGLPEQAVPAHCKHRCVLITVRHSAGKGAKARRGKSSVSGSERSSTQKAPGNRGRNSTEEIHTSPQAVCPLSWQSLKGAVLAMTNHVCDSSLKYQSTDK